MKPGDVVLVRFPQADLQAGKLRPALIVAMVPGRHPDVLLALISSRLYQATPDLDEVIAPGDSDYPASGLKAPSVVRLARLATVENSVVSARLGSIATERLQRIRQRLADWIDDSQATSQQPITRKIHLITLVVPDYDEAIRFFTQTLRFSLVEDTPLGGGKRWVVVTPGGGGASLLLAQASNSEQHSRIGNQTGGRVAFFLHTDNFRDDYRHLQAFGVRFTEAPRQEAYGTVVVFQDIYGNKWDLIEPSQPAVETGEPTGNG